MHTYMLTFVHACMHAYIQIHIHSVTHIFICINRVLMCEWVCVYACIGVYITVCLNIYRHAKQETAAKFYVKLNSKIKKI